MEAGPRKLTVTGRPRREVCPPEWCRKQEARIKRSGDRETINNCSLLARRFFLSHPLESFPSMLSRQAFLWCSRCSLSQVLPLDDSDNLLFGDVNVYCHSFQTFHIGLLSKVLYLLCSSGQAFLRQSLYPFHESPTQINQEASS